MSSKAFSRKVFSWLHQVNGDDKLPASAVKVAVRLSPGFNEDKGGMAWPGLQTIADDIGKCKSTVLEMVRCLEARGHLRVKWGQQGKGHSNRYWMILKGQQADLFETPKGQVSEPKGQPADLTHLRLIEDSSKEESDSPDDASPKKKEDSRRRKKTKNAVAEIDEAFARFWAVYPRHIAEQPARKQFALAVKRGTDPELIIEAAKRYALTEQARIERERTPQHTKYPGNWLKDERWNDPLPDGLVLDGHGNVVAIEQPISDADADDELIERCKRAGLAW
jgi:hypothetical protein